MQRHRALIGLAIWVIFFSTLTASVNAQNAGKPRPLAKGVLKTIETDLNPRDMFSLPMPLPRLNAHEYDPKTVSVDDTLHGQTRRVIMFRDNVWQYEFAFSGLRQAKLKVPNSSGGLSNRNVWYMIYRIRDTGKTMTFEQVKQNPEFEHLENDLKLDQPLPSEEKKFLPRFSLEGWVPNAKGNGYQKVVYRDQICPVVLEQIRQREDANQVLLDTHQMSTAKIPVAKNESDPGVWGVAIWKDVDPRIDFVSVFVKGLTNAFRLGRSLDDPSKLKTLQLNFWRPGDSVAQQDDRIDFGIPLMDDPRQQALVCERYDLPGPLIRVYHVNEIAKRNVLVVEADAQVDLKTFDSALTPDLDQGKLPVEIAQAFADAGLTINKDASLKTIIEGSKWALKNGQDEYILALEPQFWEPDFVGIRFIKSLDHLWIYR